MLIKGSDMATAINRINESLEDGLRQMIYGSISVTTIVCLIELLPIVFNFWLIILILLVFKLGIAYGWNLICINFIYFLIMMGVDEPNT